MVSSSFIGSMENIMIIDPQYESFAQTIGVWIIVDESFQEPENVKGITLATKIPQINLIYVSH